MRYNVTGLDEGITNEVFVGTLCRGFDNQINSRSEVIVADIDYIHKLHALA
jgi:hypothetical protein